MGQTPTSTKPATTPELEPMATQEKGELARQPEPEPVPTPMESGSASSTAFDDMAAIARRILTANPDIADRIMEHMRTQPLVPLQPEDLV